VTAQRGTWVNLDGSSNGTSALNARLAQGGIGVDDGTSGIGVRNGVFYDGQGNVVSGNTDTGPMTYSVRACQMMLYLLGTAASGVVMAVNDGLLKVSTTAAPGSNSRIDVIWARHHAVAADGGSDSDNIFQIGVTQGTAAASPTVPTIPTGAMALAQAIMPAGATNTNALTFTQVHPWTTTHGSPIPVRNSTEQAALTPYLGMQCYRLDTDAELRYSGSAWRQESSPEPALALGHKPRRIMVNTALAFASLSTATNGALGGWTADTSGDDGNTSGITVASNGLITVTKGGLYRIAAGTLFGTSGTGVIALQLWTAPTINGSLVITAGTQIRFVELANSASAALTLDADWEIVLADGATICIGARQSSGGSLSVGSTTQGAAWLTIVRDDDA
jgi:hypothetical protein